MRRRDMEREGGIQKQMNRDLITRPLCPKSVGQWLCVAGKLMSDDVCSVVCVITLAPIRPLITSSNLLHPSISTELPLQTCRVCVCATVNVCVCVCRLPVHWPPVCRRCRRGNWGSWGWRSQAGRPPAASSSAPAPSLCQQTSPPDWTMLPVRRAMETDLSINCTYKLSYVLSSFCVNGTGHLFIFSIHLMLFTGHMWLRPTAAYRGYPGVDHSKCMLQLLR